MFGLECSQRFNIFKVLESLEVSEQACLLFKKNRFKLMEMSECVVSSLSLGSNVSSSSNDCSHFQSVLLC